MSQSLDKHMNECCYLTFTSLFNDRSIFVIQLDTVWVGLWGNKSFRIHIRSRMTFSITMPGATYSTVTLRLIPYCMATGELKWSCTDFQQLWKLLCQDRASTSLAYKFFVNTSWWVGWHSRLLKSCRVRMHEDIDPDELNYLLPVTST